MTTVYVTSFNHASLDGVAEIVGLLGGEFRRYGFNTVSCRTLPEEIKDGDLLVVVDEFSEPLVVEALKSFRLTHSEVTLVCVLTEFFSPRNWTRPPSLNSFKQPLQSLLLDNFLYVFCSLSGHLRLFTSLRIKSPGPVHYVLSILGLLWLGLQKARKPRTPLVKLRTFHERGYLWFRALGLQSVSGIFDFFLALHPDIGSEALAAALGTSREKIYTLLVPPPIVEKSSLVNSALEFGIDFSGSLSNYRKRQIKTILRILEKISPGRRFALHMERGFDDSKMKLLLSFNPPQSSTWRYSSPMRIIGAIKRGQIPIVSEKFGDHPAEDLALLVPHDLYDMKDFVAGLVFYKSHYVHSAWEKLENYRKIVDENNRKILSQLQAHKTRQ